jgi:tyrosyl-tRNA synthetase
MTPKIITDEAIIDNILSRGVEAIYPDRLSLKKLLLSGRPLRLYCGYDPTAPTLHIGHGITIRKLAKFQSLGHHVIFLFGDFTAQIGDPTDKLAARQPLTPQQIKKNLKGWKQQIKNIIDIDRIDFQFNSRWLGKLKFADLIKISSYFTAQQIAAREMFKQRMAQGKDLYFHEFLYPLMQAYDSVALDVDLEIGGNDQMFNMLAGRDLMKKMLSKEKFVLTTKLLEDSSGKKMGKSEGNMITLVDKPEEMYGKIMSWPDELILPAWEILTDVSDKTLLEIKNQLASKGINPRDIKMKLAKEVVEVYQGQSAALSAEASFKRVFQEKQKPLEIPKVVIADQNGQLGILDLFVKAGLAASNSEARRLIKEKALRIDDKLVTDETLQLNITTQGLLLQRGKKLFRRVFTK